MGAGFLRQVRELKIQRKNPGSTLSAGEMPLNTKVENLGSAFKNVCKYDMYVKIYDLQLINRV
jgi:hypothetical protein